MHRQKINPIVKIDSSLWKDFSNYASKTGHGATTLMENLLRKELQRAYITE